MEVWPIFGTAPMALMLEAIVPLFEVLPQSSEALFASRPRHPHYVTLRYLARHDVRNVLSPALKYVRTSTVSRT